MTTLKYKVCWTLTDGSAGMVSQVQGLAQAIGCGQIVAKRYRVRAPWRWLPARLAALTTPRLTADSDPLARPWPHLLISCGRRSVPLALAIRKASKGKTLCVHIQNPRVSARCFDWVVAPWHDQLKGKNVIETLGAVHVVTEQALAEGAGQFSQRFAAYPKPWMAVMIGGNSNRYQFKPEAARALGQQLQAVLDQHPGSLLITPSRRTSGEAFNQVLAELTDSGRVFVAEDLQRDNPYFGMLALADVLMVTEDSVSMVSEACGTAKPVYVLPLQGHPVSKAKRFIEMLVDKKMVRWLGSSIDSWSYPPFNDTQVVADKIRAILATR